MSRELSKGTIGYILFAAVVGILSAFFGQPLIHANDQATNVIVTVFSILAGFLIAIMTIVGEPSSFGRRSWRAAELTRSTVYQRLARQKWMFYLYLVTLGVIFADTLISKVAAQVGIWLEYVYMGLATMAFLLSMSLPVTLMKIQLDRHDEMIDHRRGKPSDKGD